MENKSHAMAAGIFVVVLALLVLGLASWLTRDTGVRHVYEISTRESVTGLQEQAPVRYRGVEVGKVSAIGFDPKTSGNVLLRLQIDREAPVTRETFATLSYQGVTGLAYVQLDDEGKTSGARLQPNDEVPPRIPLRPGFMTKLQDRGEVIVEQVSQAAERLNKLLDEENQRRIAAMVTNIGQAAASADKLAQTTEVLMRDIDGTLKRRVDPLLAESAVTLKSVRNSSEEIGRAATEFGRTAQRINEKGGPLEQIAESTKSLNHAADVFSNGTLPRLNRATEQATRTLRQLGRTADTIQDNPQALLYGTGKPEPGPGEPGFTPPGARR